MTISRCSTFLRAHDISRSTQAEELDRTGTLERDNRTLKAALNITTRCLGEARSEVGVLTEKLNLLRLKTCRLRESLYGVARECNSDIKVIDDILSGLRAGKEQQG